MLQENPYHLLIYHQKRNISKDVLQAPETTRMDFPKGPAEAYLKDKFKHGSKNY